MEWFLQCRVFTNLDAGYSRIWIPPLGYATASTLEPGGEGEDVRLGQLLRLRHVRAFSAATAFFSVAAFVAFAAFDVVSESGGEGGAGGEGEDVRLGQLLRLIQVLSPESTTSFAFFLTASSSNVFFVAASHASKNALSLNAKAAASASAFAFSELNAKVAASAFAFRGRAVLEAPEEAEARGLAAFAFGSHILHPELETTNVIDNRKVM